MEVKNNVTPAQQMLQDLNDITIFVMEKWWPSLTKHYQILNELEKQQGNCNLEDLIKMLDIKVDRSDKMQISLNHKSFQNPDNDFNSLGQKSNDQAYQKLFNFKFTQEEEKIFDIIKIKEKFRVTNELKQKRHVEQQCNLCRNFLNAVCAKCYPTNPIVICSHCHLQ